MVYIKSGRNVVENLFFMTWCHGKKEKKCSTILVVAPSGERPPAQSRPISGSQRRDHHFFTTGTRLGCCSTELLVLSTKLRAGVSATLLLLASLRCSFRRQNHARRPRTWAKSIQRDFLHDHQRSACPKHG